MTQPILQCSLPYAPWMDPSAWRLPGTQPLDPATWLVTDDAFESQMSHREHLIAARPDAVHALLPEAEAAASECLDAVLHFLPNLTGYLVEERGVTRPDGARVEIDRTAPLITIGRLIQEDVCLMLPTPGEHVLGGAILCFPASWTLSQKFGRPLMRIHAPVPKYDEDVGKRVQRLFDAIRADRPMWRANAHLEDSPELFAARREEEPHPGKSDRPPYLRSERQTLMRLPETGAVVFTIHTWMVAVRSLTDAQRDTLDAVRAQYRP